MQVGEGADEITLHLQAEPDTQFDEGELSACLDRTIAKSQRN